MRAATEGHLPPAMPQGNLVEVLGREVNKGSPGERMVESSPSRQRRPPCKTSKEMSDEAADAAALTYLLTLVKATNLTSSSIILTALSAPPCILWTPCQLSHTAPPQLTFANSSTTHGHYLSATP